MAVPINAANKMVTEAVLKEKLQKVEALLAGATTPGERDAAQAARERIQVRLRELANQGRLVEMPFHFDNEWTLRLFQAVCRTNGLAPYRKPRQRRCSVMVQVDRDFLYGELWVKFKLMASVFKIHLHEAASQYIKDEILNGMEDFVSW